MAVVPQTQVTPPVTATAAGSLPDSTFSPSSTSAASSMRDPACAAANASAMAPFSLRRDAAGGTPERPPRLDHRVPLPRDRRLLDRPFLEHPCELCSAVSGRGCAATCRSQPVRGGHPPAPAIHHSRPRRLTHAHRSWSDGRPGARWTGRCAETSADGIEPVRRGIKRMQPPGVAHLRRANGQGLAPGACAKSTCHLAAAAASSSGGTASLRRSCTSKSPRTRRRAC